ncbi:MAG: Spy/CpxP family protein refolding chaperone [Bryobacteraceae bacterium]
MKMKLALLTAVASLAMAQGMRGPMGMGMGPGGGGAAPTFDNIKTYLTLTDSQLTAIEAIRTSARTANQQTMTDLRTKETALQALLKSSNPDPAAVGKLMVDIQALRATMHTANTSLTDQAVALLTPDQKTKLASLAAAAALQPQIHEASMLLLLTPPAHGAGEMGPGGMGHGMMGMGPGRR